jgi:hypothetical protein
MKRCRITAAFSKMRGWGKKTSKILNLGMKVSEIT